MADDPDKELEEYNKLSQEQKDKDYDERITYKPGDLQMMVDGKTVSLEDYLKQTKDKAPVTLHIHPPEIIDDPK